MKAANQIGVFNGNILVLKDAEIVYKTEIGYADSTKTRLLNSENCFVIGSISKEFNGVGIMILKEKGKLNLTDKISKYLPQLPQGCRTSL